MKANCASARLTSFSADKVMTTCLVLHTDYHIFSSIIDASVNLVRGFPLRVKKETKKNQALNLWIDLENFKCCFSETRENLAFYMTASTRHVHLMFLSIRL